MECRAGVWVVSRDFWYLVGSRTEGGDKCRRALTERAEKMAREECARRLAMEKMFSDERERCNELETRLIDALTKLEWSARIHEAEARQIANRVTEAMRVHAEDVQTEFETTGNTQNRRVTDGVATQ